VRALATVAAPVLLGACCLSVRALATAPPPPVVLAWQGPDDCQQAPRLLAAVERVLGGQRAAASLVARVSVAKAGRRWHLVLGMDLAGNTAVRELDAESCAVVTDAAAVILALAIDELGHPADAGPPMDASDASIPTVDAQVAPHVPAPPSTTDLPPVADTTDAGAAASSSLPLVLFATAASDTGALPRTAFGVGGGLGFIASPLRVEATLAFWPAVSAEVGAASRGGSFTMLVGELRGCALAEPGLLSLGACAGPGFTSMRAEAFGVTTPISTGAAWASLVADGVALARLSRRFSLRASAGVAVPFARPPFEIEGVGVVHRPSAVALDLGAGVEAHF